MLPHISFADACSDLPPVKEGKEIDGEKYPGEIENIPAARCKCSETSTTYFVQSTKDNKRWTLAPNMAQVIKNSPPKEVAGEIPINAAYLTVWCYRKKEVASIEDAVKDFTNEFVIERLRFSA